MTKRFAYSAKLVTLSTLSKGFVIASRDPTRRARGAPMLRKRPGQHRGQTVANCANGKRCGRPRKLTSARCAISGTDRPVAMIVDRRGMIAIPGADECSSLYIAAPSAEGRFPSLHNHRFSVAHETCHREMKSVHHVPKERFLVQNKLSCTLGNIFQNAWIC
jgi:hypothetical protein